MSVSVQNLEVEALTPSAIAGGKVFGRYVDDVSGALLNVVGVFIKKAPARSFAPPTT